MTIESEYFTDKNISTPKKLMEWNKNQKDQNRSDFENSDRTNHGEKEANSNAVITASDQDTDSPQNLTLKEGNEKSRVADPLLLERRTSGRYKMAAEDKAKAIPLKLHAHHREILDWIPGDNNAEKIRGVLEDHHSMKSRERKQIREIFKRVDFCFELGEKCFVPTPDENDLELKVSNVRKFLSAFNSFEKLITLYHFDLNALGGYLSKEEAKRLNSIFYKREFLNSEISNGKYKDIGLE